VNPAARRARAIAAFHALVKSGSPDECWEWTGSCDKDGYGIFKRVGFERRAHRLALSLASPEPVPSDLMVLHRCDNPPCCNPAHLFIGDAAENMHDRHRKGRYETGDSHWTRKKPASIRRGSSLYNAKFTAAEVDGIRSALARGERQTDVARRLGVCPKTINHIAIGKSYRGTA
jgi:hypothetical protein